MTTQRPDMNTALAKWIQSAPHSDQMDQYGFESIEVTDLLTNSSEENGIIPTSLALYEELIKQYEPYSETLMAALIFSLEYTSGLEKYSFEEVLSGDLQLRQPPEFYLIKRRPEERFVDEEYKKSITHSNIVPAYGKIQSYFHSTRDDDFFANEFWFKHYPDSCLEVVNGATYVNYK